MTRRDAFCHYTSSLLACLAAVSLGGAVARDDAIGASTSLILAAIAYLAAAAFREGHNK